jgi:hypothetical protein
MDESRAYEIAYNKNIRGYILRLLAMCNRNTLLVRQITNKLLADELITTPDIGKHLDYLMQAGYIELIDKSVTPYTAYRLDAVIKLTKDGTDLMEYTITDPGVEV